MLTMDGESRPISGLVWIRAAIALFQVVVLILAVAVPIHMSPPWDAAALAVIVVVPCIAVAGVGNVRLLPLAIWLVACTALVSGFTFLAETSIDRSLPGGAAFVRSLANLSIVSLLVFLCHCAVAAGAADGRLIARWSTYLETSRALGTRVVVAGFVVALFWLFVILIAQGIDRSGLDVSKAAWTLDWFALPATLLLGNVVFHAIDVHARRASSTRSQGA
jgi:hypothetical protein